VSPVFLEVNDKPITVQQFADATVTAIGANSRSIRWLTFAVLIQGLAVILLVAASVL
jgi:hypothetical protein